MPCLPLAIGYSLFAKRGVMDESIEPANKQTERRPSRLLWIAIILMVIGSLVAMISLLVLAQPVSEENLWTVAAIPGLIVGGCVTFVGVVALIVNGALRGRSLEEPGEGG
jgi:nitrate reductase gamma subunit